MIPMRGRFTSTCTLALAALLAAAAVGAARADEPYYPIDLARPLAAPQSTLLMLDRGGQVLPFGALRFSAQVLGGHTPIEVKDEHLTVLRIDDAVSAAANAAVGFGVADLGVTLPVNLFVGGQREGRAWRATGLGDLVVVPRVSPLPPADRPVALVLSVPLTMPTGDSEAYSGHHGFTAEPRLLFAASPGRTVIGVRPGVRIQGGRLHTPAAISDWLTVRAAVGVEIGAQRRYRPELGFEGALAAGEPDLAGGEILAGLAARPVDGLVLSAHGGLGFGSLPGTARYRVAVCIGWESGGRTPQMARGDDLDGDGVSDRRDACPDQPEDLDRHRDSDGCPDPDNDGDGIADPADACPDQGAPAGAGCPPGMVSPDLDDDGVLEDACPLQPEDLDRYEDGDGCPDPDNDGDRILDEEDACPDDAEDGRGPDPRDGCPR